MDNNENNSQLTHWVRMSSFPDYEKYSKSRQTLFGDSFDAGITMETAPVERVSMVKEQYSLFYKEKRELLNHITIHLPFTYFGAVTYEGRIISETATKKIQITIPQDKQLCLDDIPSLRNIKNIVNYVATHFNKQYSDVLSEVSSALENWKNKDQRFQQAFESMKVNCQELKAKGESLEKIVDEKVSKNSSLTNQLTSLEAQLNAQQLDVQEKVKVILSSTNSAEESHIRAALLQMEVDAQAQRIRFLESDAKRRENQVDSQDKRLKLMNMDVKRLTRFLLEKEELVTMLENHGEVAYKSLEKLKIKSDTRCIEALDLVEKLKKELQASRIKNDKLKGELQTKKKELEDKFLRDTRFRRLGHIFNLCNMGLDSIPISFAREPIKVGLASVSTYCLATDDASWTYEFSFMGLGIMIYLMIYFLVKKVVSKFRGKEKAQAININLSSLSPETKKQTFDI